MAVINPTVDLNPYATQLAQLERRKRMADLLQQQGMEPIESQTVGGRVIPISPWQVLAKALQTGIGAYQTRKANEAADELQNKMAYDQRSQEAEDLATQQAMAGRLYGEKSTSPIPSDFDHQMGGTPMPDKPSTLNLQPGQLASGQRNQALAEALKAGRSVGSDDQLEEITPTGKYIYDPKAAMQMAMTPQGLRAMQQNPLIAAGITAAMKPKEADEFGTEPRYDKDGNAYIVSKQGNVKYLSGIGQPTKEPTGTNLAKLIAERDALPANSPSRAIYDAAIKKETERPPGVTVNMGNKAGTEMLEHFGKQLDTAYQSANASTRTLNVLDRLQNLTKQGTYTGAMAPNAIGAAQFLESFGIKADPKVLANSQAFEAAKNDLVLKFMSANGGARGFTEKESAMLYDAFPKLVQSPEARSQIIDALRSNAEANITDYNNKLMQFQNTYKGTPIPYQPIETPEMRYERWKRSQQGGK